MRPRLARAPPLSICRQLKAHLDRLVLTRFLHPNVLSQPEEGIMKRTSNKFILACGAALLLSAAGAQAVTYQAENYNAYYDTTAGNSGGAFRNDNVDIQPTTDAGGGYNVG